MKNLTGMKKNFSSLENKKLQDLKTLKGVLLAGGSSTMSAYSNAGGATDTDYYKDDTSGVWTWDHRFTVG